MNTSTNSGISSKHHILESPSVKVLVAWGCGLLWGCGLSLFIMFFFFVTFSGFLGGSSPPISGTLWLVLGLGLLMQFISSSLLGIFLARERYGIVTGVPAMAVGVIALLATYVGGGVLGAIIGPIRWLYMIFITMDLSPLVPGIPSAATVTTLIIMNMGVCRSRRLGLALGIAIGLGLSIVSVYMPGQNLLAFVWQVPSLMWATVVYFVELERGQGGRRAFLTWLLLVVITFCLPFVIVPLFPKTT